MEIGNHGIDHLETIPRRNKQARRAMKRFDLPIKETRHALQYAHSRCAYCDDAPTRLTRLIYQFRRWRAQVDLFAMHFMIADIFDFYRPERIQPHVQGDKTNPYSLLAQLLQ